MAIQNIVYIYQEFFSYETQPFSKTFQDRDLLELVKKVFVETGGCKIVDLQISSTETWRMSYWKNEAGYQAWQENESIKEYITKRNDYNLKNNISTDLRGPFKADEIFTR